MKKTGCIMMFILLSFCFFGCAGRTDEIAGYQISYKSEDGFKLTGQNYVPEAKEGDALIRELLDAIRYPSGITVISCIPEAVSILGFERNEQHLTVNLNKEYSKLDPMPQVLLRASIVKTLVQIPEVLDVTFQVDGKPMLDAKGNEVGTLDAASFIDAEGEGINSYQFASLALYFSNQEGDRIVKEMRNIYYSTNTSLGKVVVEQLQSGPVNEKLEPVIPKAAKIIDIFIKSNVCTVNFDAEFNREISNTETKPETTIYAIVNALCDACDVSKVQIQIAGDSNVKYRDTVSLAEPFERNKDIILTVEGTADTTKETVKETAKETDKETVTEEQNREPSLGVDPNLKENGESDKKGE